MGSLPCESVYNDVIYILMMMVCMPKLIFSNFKVLKFRSQILVNDVALLLKVGSLNSAFLHQFRPHVDSFMVMAFSILSVKVSFAEAFLFCNLRANLVKLGHQRMEFTEVILKNLLANVKLCKSLFEVSHSFQRLSLSKVAHDPDINLRNSLALKL